MGRTPRASPRLAASPPGRVASRNTIRAWRKQQRLHGLAVRYTGARTRATSSSWRALARGTTARSRRSSTGTGAGLLSFCVHMLGSREWGEDALQLTLTSAYQALSRGRRPDALRPWLYTIARNRCLSELRSRRELAGSDAIVVERAELDGPPSLVARREQLRELVEDIQRLPDDQRAALVMFELGDYSHAEIASVLNVRCDKVKALIFQAREGLMRGRTARESPCSEVRERMASARGNDSRPRSSARAHRPLRVLPGLRA